MGRFISSLHLVTKSITNLISTYKNFYDNKTCFPTAVFLILKQKSSLLFVVFAIGNLLAGAYCYAELGCMIKKTGADYAYIMVTFGKFLAFIRLWVECIIVRPCSQAIVALTFSIYATKPFFPECDPPDESVRLLAAVSICKSFIINRSVGWRWFQYLGYNSRLKRSGFKSA